MQRSPSCLSRAFKWAFTSGSDQVHGVAQLRWAQAVWLQVSPGSYTAEHKMRMKSPVQSFLLSCLAVNILGEHGVRSGQTLTAVTRGTNEKMRLQQHQKIAASKCSNYQNRRDLKYLIAPLWDYQLSERGKKIRTEKLMCRKWGKGTKMVTWLLGSVLKSRAWVRKSQLWNSNRDISSSSRLAEAQGFVHVWWKDCSLNINFSTRRWSWHQIQSHPKPPECFCCYEQVEAVSPWRVTPLCAHGSSGDGTDLVRNKSSRGSCRHSVEPGKTLPAFITGCAALIRGRWGIDDNFRVHKLNLHPE